MGAELVGADDIRRKLGEVLERMREASAAAVRLQAVALAEAAQAVVPVESGRLRDSIYVTEHKIAGSTATVEVGYGVPYAAMVHEVGKFPKWLEQTVNARAQEMHQAMANEIGGALSGAMPSAASDLPTEPHDPGRMLSPRIPRGRMGRVIRFIRPRRRRHG